MFNTIFIEVKFKIISLLDIYIWYLKISGNLVVKYFNTFFFFNNLFLRIILSLLTFTIL